MARKVLLLTPSQDFITRMVHSITPPDDSTEIIPRLGGMTDLISAIADAEFALIVAALPDMGTEDLVRLELPLAGNPTAAVVLVRLDASAEFLLKAMRVGVREVIIPDSDTALTTAISRHLGRIGGDKSRKSKGKVIAFMPAKGGSGATFLAANLGYALSVQGHRAAVVDMNLQFGDTSLFLTDRQPKSNLATLSREAVRLDPAFLEASMLQVADNLWLLASPDSPEQSVSVRAETVDQILKLLRQQFDFVILDVGRMLESVNIRALDEAEVIYLVLQATLPGLHNTRRVVSVLNGLGYGRDKIRVVVNRWEKSSEIGSADINKSLGYDVDMHIPNSFSNVLYSINHGTPIVKHAPKDPVSLALWEWAQSLAPARIESVKSSWLRSLFGVRA